MNLLEPDICPIDPVTFRPCLVSHGGGVAGSASGDEAAGLAERTVHQVPGTVSAAQQTHPAGRDPRQGHAGKSYWRVAYNLPPHLHSSLTS